MATIPIDFEGVESFDNLPLGRYYGSIDKIEHREPSEPGKFAQLMVSYLVIDGEMLGRKQSEFLSMSPKAAFRLKKWFDLFGLADGMTGLDIDDDTSLLTDPDLVGVNVVFEVYQDPKLYQGEVQIRTRLLEVEAEEVVPAPKAKKPKKAPEPVVEEDDEEEEEDDEPEAVAEPAQKKRTFTPKSKAPVAAAAGPARRSLR